MIDETIIQQMLDGLSEKFDIESPAWGIADIDRSFFRHVPPKIFFSRQSLEDGSDAEDAKEVAHEWRHWNQFVKGFCQLPGEICSDIREHDAVEFTASYTRRGE